MKSIFCVSIFLFTYLFLIFFFFFTFRKSNYKITFNSCYEKIFIKKFSINFLLSLKKKMNKCTFIVQIFIYVSLAELHKSHVFFPTVIKANYFIFYEQLLRSNVELCIKKKVYIYECKSIYENSNRGKSYVNCIIKRTRWPLSCIFIIIVISLRIRALYKDLGKY